MGARLAIAGHVATRAWRSERRVLLATWAAVSFLMIPLLGMALLSSMLRRVWESTTRGAYIWTKSDGAALGQPILGQACQLNLDAEGANGFRRSAWVMQASLWSSMGWQVHWMQQPVSPSTLLLVPPPRGQFRTHRLVGGERLPVAGLVRPPRVNQRYQPPDAFLLLRDSITVVGWCGARLGVVRGLNILPTMSPDVSPSQWRVISTPGSLAYSDWLATRRVLIGVMIGALIALFVITAAAAHFWAAGEAPAWAIARLVGCPWPLLRWQVAVESAWLLIPGLLVATIVNYALFDWLSRWYGFGTVPVGAFIAVTGSTLLVLGLTLATLLYGRMRRLNPIDGLREAHEWHG